jgi:hypothetical protein
MSAQCYTPVLFGCCPSSGSTLLSVLLNTHSAILCGPEMTVFSHPALWKDSGESWRQKLFRHATAKPKERIEQDWPMLDYSPYLGVAWTNFEWYQSSASHYQELLVTCSDSSQLIDQLISPALETRNKQVWVEKSPPNIFSIAHFLESLPETNAIVMVRDGRDVVSSLIRRGFYFSDACLLWVVETALCLALAENERVHYLRYEDLVNSPEAELQRLFASLQLPDESAHILETYQHSDRALEDPTITCRKVWQANPDSPISSNSVDRWQTDLSEPQKQLFLRCALKEDLGALQTLCPAILKYAGKSTEDLLRQIGRTPHASTELSTDAWLAIWQEEGLLRHLNLPSRYVWDFADLHTHELPIPAPEELLGMLASMYDSELERQRLERALEQAKARASDQQKRQKLLEQKLALRKGPLGALRELTGINNVLEHHAQKDENT